MCEPVSVWVRSFVFLSFIIAFVLILCLCFLTLCRLAFSVYWYLLRILLSGWKNGLSTWLKLRVVSTAEGRTDICDAWCECVCVETQRVGNRGETFVQGDCLANRFRPRAERRKRERTSLEGALKGIAWLCKYTRRVKQRSGRSITQHSQRAQRIPQHHHPGRKRWRSD